MRRIAAAIALAALAAAGCGSDSSHTPRPEDLTHPPKVAATVSVDGDTATPAQVDLTLGQAFTVTNDGNEAVRLATGSDEYDTGRLPPGATVTVVPGKAGRLVLTGTDRPRLRLVVEVRTRSDRPASR